MRRKWIPVISVLFVLIATTAFCGTADLANALVDAHKQGKLLPLVSAIDPKLDETGAYAVQRDYVTQRLKGDSVAGFKAGLTTAAGQKKFGVSDPVAGVLYGSGKMTGSPVIFSKGYAALMVETELAFQAGRTITKPVKSVAELKRSFSSVMPSIELPDMNFKTMQGFRGVDLIAANVSAVSFIAGPKTRMGHRVDPNSFSVVLTRDGEKINAGKAPDALGDQWKALLWLVNRSIESGWKIEAGDIFMTGALGNMIPGKPGKYVADFGTLGKVMFEIR
jgi:2-keto-4-pentenoate hydratase